MHRFHFNNFDVDFEQLQTWFAIRNTPFTLMSKRSVPHNKDWMTEYDISVLSDEIALELLLTFDVKQDESKLQKLKREREELLKHMRQLKIQLKQNTK